MWRKTANLQPAAKRLSAHLQRIVRRLDVGLWGMAIRPHPS